MPRATPISLNISSAGFPGGGRVLARFGLLALGGEPRAALRFPLTVTPADGRGGPAVALSAVGFPRGRGEGVWCLAEAALPPGRYRVRAGDGRPMLFEVPRRPGMPVTVLCGHDGARSRMERHMAYAPHGEVLAIAGRTVTRGCCAAAALRVSRLRPEAETVAILYGAVPVRRETLEGRPLTLRRGEYVVFGPKHRPLLSSRQPFPMAVSVVRIGTPILRSVRELLGLGQEADPFGFDPVPRRMTPSVREALNQVVRALSIPDATGHSLAVTAACQNLLLFLVREHPGGLAGRGPTAPFRSPEERLRRAMAHVQDRHAGPCLLREIAAAAGVSRTRLITLFKERLQTTPNDYLQSVRVERAKALLADRSRTVAAVADAVGYRDVRHFRRVFKAHAGKGIRAFRVW